MHRCCSRYYAPSPIDRDRAPTCDVRRASLSSFYSNACRAQSVLQEVRREEPSITLRGCATKLGLTSLEVIYYTRIVFCNGSSHFPLCLLFAVGYTRSCAPCQRVDINRTARRIIKKRTQKEKKRCLENTFP